VLIKQSVFGRNKGLKMARSVIHFTLHLLAPGLAAWVGFKDRWKQAWLIMALTMLVDLDHLLTTPVYDPNRCGIGLHPLHSTIAIGAYVVILAFPKLRIVGVGLLIHMILDAIDCLWIGLG
jgi:hypothetical protein